MGEPFQPINLIAKRPWKSRTTVFDFDGIDELRVWATLRQWAMSPHLHAEIVREARSCQGFANKHGCSVNQLRNMLNGHRVVDYPTMAMVLAKGNPKLMPSESDIAGSIANAFERASKSEEKRPEEAPRPPASDKLHRSGYLNLGDSPDSPDTRARRPRIHPDAEQIAAIYADQLLSNKLVRRYLADHGGGEAPEIELTVFETTDPDAQGADGFIAGNVLGGSLWICEPGLTRFGLMDLTVAPVDGAEADVWDLGFSAGNR